MAGIAPLLFISLCGFLFLWITWLWTWVYRSLSASRFYAFGPGPVIEVWTLCSSVVSFEELHGPFSSAPLLSTSPLLEIFWWLVAFRALEAYRPGLCMCLTPVISSGEPWLCQGIQVSRPCCEVWGSPLTRVLIGSGLWPYIPMPTQGPVLPCMIIVKAAVGWDMGHGLVCSK